MQAESLCFSKISAVSRLDFLKPSSKLKVIMCFYHYCRAICQSILAWILQQLTVPKVSVYLDGYRWSCFEFIAKINAEYYREKIVTIYFSSSFFKPSSTVAQFCSICFSCSSLSILSCEIVISVFPFCGCNS